MEVYQAIMKRRSIRKYDDRPVTRDIIERLLRAAMQAPSAANQRPWEFIIVQDREGLEKLSLAHPYAGPVKTAAAAILVLGKKEGMLFPQYWQQDLAAATQNILLAAVEEGLGAVWTGIAPEEDRMAYIKTMFDLPEGVMPFALLALGFSTGNVEHDRFDEARIHYEKYKADEAISK